MSCLVTVKGMEKYTFFPQQNVFKIGFLLKIVYGAFVVSLISCISCQAPPRSTSAVPASPAPKTAGSPATRSIINHLTDHWLRSPML
jgi:hypothetical protein